MFKHSLKSIAKSVSFLPFSRQQKTPGTALVPFAFGGEQRPLPSEIHQITIALDKSPSTYVCSAASEIHQGSDQCVRQIRRHPQLRRTTEFAVFGFGKHTPAECYCDFTPAESFTMPELPDSYGTWIDDLYIRILEANLLRMEQHSLHCDQDVRSAWVFYFSDFLTGPMPRLDEALRLRDQATEAGVNIFLIGAGKNYDERTAAQLSQPGRPPLPMRSVDDFLKFFDWLFRSLRAKSVSAPGAPLQLEDLFGKSLRADG